MRTAPRRETPRPRETAWCPCPVEWMVTRWLRERDYWSAYVSPPWRKPDRGSSGSVVSISANRVVSINISLDEVCPAVLFALRNHEIRSPLSTPHHCSDHLRRYSRPGPPVWQREISKLSPLSQNPSVLALPAHRCRKPALCIRKK